MIKYSATKPYTINTGGNKIAIMTKSKKFDMV